MNILFKKEIENYFVKKYFTAFYSLQNAILKTSSFYNKRFITDHQLYFWLPIILVTYNAWISGCLL